MKKLSENQQTQVEEIGFSIVRAFEAGEVPKALGKIFLYSNSGVDMPSYRWSYANRLVAYKAGHIDAAGFKQWKEFGRKVRKGAKSFRILAPMIYKAKEDDDERGIKAGDPVVRGYKPIPVFGYEDTEGEPLPGREGEPEFLDSLPLIEVARHWGLKTLTFPGRPSPRMGFYRHGEAIGVGVENLSVWAHELVHAADHRRGSLVKKYGQDLSNEVVAQLGGSILLEALGYEAESDRGFTFEYIEEYCDEHQVDLVATCMVLLDRTCQAVQLLLDTAEELQAQAA